MVKVTRPSTSAGRSAASASAARTASAASRSSLRPESLENSVAPMPAMAAFITGFIIGASPIRTVPVTWSPRPHRPVTETTCSAPSDAVTCPVRVSVSPAWQGTPSRIEMARTTAPGAQSHT